MKKFKKAVMLFLSLLMIIGIFDVNTEAAPVDFGSVELGQDYVKMSKTPSGKSGQKISIKFSVYNPEGSDMEDATIQLLNEEDFKNALEIEDEDEETTSVVAEYPFEYEQEMFEEKTLGDIKSHKTKGYSRSYRLRRDLKEGYYPAVFRLRYNSGDYVDFGVNIWVTVSDSSTDGDNDKVDYDFAMGEGQSTPYADYSQVMDFGVNLRNSGLKKVYDVRVSMQLDADITKFPFDINDGNYDRAMGDMESGQTVSIPYSMAVREKVKSGFYPIAFKILYREESGGDFITTPVDKVFYVRVRGEDDDDELSDDAGENERTKARIIVESFSTDPGDVYAGNVFTLHVKMKNASADVEADNIMFTFTSEAVENSPIFTTSTGSTSLVVNHLSPGASADLQLQFESSPTAEQKSYVMTIVEQYDSPEFKNAKEEVKISIPVKQKPRLNTGTIEVMPDNITVGAESNVMFGINNTGKVLLYNVTARFEGDSIQPSDAYVGNIKPGETGNVDTMITGAAPTTDEGKIKIIISFEDENGEVTEIEKEMILTVTEALPEDMGDMEAGNMDMDAMEPEPTFFGKYKFPIIGAAVLAVIAVVSAVVIRKKKKKAAEEEGMDDEIS